MSALDEIKERFVEGLPIADIELCVLTASATVPGNAKQAAAELATLRAQLDEAVKWHEGEDSPHARLEQEIARLQAVEQAARDVVADDEEVDTKMDSVKRLDDRGRIMYKPVREKLDK